MKIDDLRKAISEGVEIGYTAHCRKRMSERGITQSDIVNCIMNGEIIEDYPLSDNNKSEESFPSCLILWVDVNKDGAIHIVVGYNEIKIIIISAYHPSKDAWEDDYKTRKEK